MAGRTSHHMLIVLDTILALRRRIARNMTVLAARMLQH